MYESMVICWRWRGAFTETSSAVLQSGIAAGRSSTRCKGGNVAGRDCIVPEVSRNRNIGEVGANMNAATFRKFLNGMAWAQVPVTDFGDLAYLHQTAYEAKQAELVSSAHLWQGSFKDARFEPGKVKPCPEAGGSTDEPGAAQTVRITVCRRSVQ